MPRTTLSPRPQMLHDVGEPDFVGPTGIRWWLDKGLTKWAKAPLGSRKSPLPEDTRAYLTEFPDGEKNYVVIMDGKPVFDSKSMEGIAVWLDAQKLLLLE